MSPPSTIHLLSLARERSDWNSSKTPPTLTGFSCRLAEEAWPPGSPFSSSSSCLRSRSSESSQLSRHVWWAALRAGRPAPRARVSRFAGGGRVGLVVGGPAIAAGKPVTLDQVSLFAEGVAVARIGAETFRLLKDHLDDVVTVDSDEISAAVKDLFDDVRAVAEPAGAVALAGLKKYARAHDIHGEKLATVLSGANLNFGSLRHIAERAEIGGCREGMFGVIIDERPGAFLDFCHLLGGRMVTEFNYRLADDTSAAIFVGVQLAHRDERSEIVDILRRAGLRLVDLSDDEAAKTHVRYMIGGHPSRSVGEKAVSFVFPESPGALTHFLTTLGARWNISLFHYRSFAIDTGRVLAGFEGAADDPDLPAHLDNIGYPWSDVSDSPAYQMFLRER